MSCRGLVSLHLCPLCSQLFSIVVLGCVANEGYINRPDEEEEYCIFNRNQHACAYAVTTGTLCFLCSAAFLALDVYFPQISGVNDRKKAVVADIGVSGETPPPLVTVTCFSNITHVVRVLMTTEELCVITMYVACSLQLSGLWSGSWVSVFWPINGRFLKKKTTLWTNQPMPPEPPSSSLSSQSSPGYVPELQQQQTLLWIRY